MIIIKIILFLISIVLISISYLLCIEIFDAVKNECYGIALLLGIVVLLTCSCSVLAFLTAIYC